MKLVPAIDMIAGRCVRLRQGAYGSAVFYERTPLDQALWLQDQGFTRLHLVDLDGARMQQLIHLEAIENITQRTGLEVDFGGGVRDVAAVRWLLDVGVQWINLGSMAALQPDTTAAWLRDFGADKFIIGMDLQDGKVKVNGWATAVSLTPQQMLTQYAAQGISKVCCTDISRDGMLQGPNTGLYRSLMQDFPSLQFTASGGIASIGDVAELEAAGLTEAISGKAIFENRLDMQQLKPYL